MKYRLLVKLPHFISLSNIICSSIVLYFFERIINECERSESSIIIEAKLLVNEVSSLISSRALAITELIFLELLIN